jgi:hypothetical protein
MPLRSYFQATKDHLARPPPCVWISRSFGLSSSSLLSSKPRPPRQARNETAFLVRKTQRQAERETREAVARNVADAGDFTRALRAYNRELTRQQRVADETTRKREALAADEERHRAGAEPAPPTATGRFAVLGKHSR